MQDLQLGCINRNDLNLPFQSISVLVSLQGYICLTKTGKVFFDILCVPVFCKYVFLLYKKI